MEQDTFTTQEVIEALQSVGIAEEVIEYVVPIAGYESRVDGVPFTLKAEDRYSPSFGIFQANVNSMAPGIYKAMKELGVVIPGISEDQDRVLSKNTAQPGEESLLNFTTEQKDFVSNWFKSQATLQDNALVFKYMYEQKAKDKKTDDYEIVVNELYPFTVSKFADESNVDAQELKLEIEKQMSMTPVTTTTTIPSTTTTTTVVDDGEETVTEPVDPTKRTRRELEMRKNFEGKKYIEAATPGNFMKSYEQMVDLIEANINASRKENGLPPITREQAEQGAYMSSSDDMREAIDILRGITSGK